MECHPISYRNVVYVNRMPHLTNNFPTDHNKRTNKTIEQSFPPSPSPILQVSALGLIRFDSFEQTLEITDTEAAEKRDGDIE